MSELKKAEMLKETIKQTFEANAEETELLVTADGNCFLAKDKNHAELHARSTNQTLETVKREDFISKEVKRNKKSLENIVVEEVEEEEIKEIEVTEGEVIEEEVTEEELKTSKKTKKTK